MFERALRGEPLYVRQFPLAVDGIATRVLECVGGDEHVVMLHGAGARADRWLANLRALAGAGFHVHAIDLPGHGFADKPADFDHSADGYIRYLQSYLRCRDVGTAAIVGSSIGARVAAGLAIRDPERVSALVLVCPIGLVAIGQATTDRMGSGMHLADVDACRRKLEFVVADPSLVTQAWIVEESYINSSPGAEAALRRVGSYIANRLDSEVCGAALESLTPRPPVLVVWGADDRGVPVGLADDVRTVLPDAEFVVIVEAAHQPYFEQPDHFNAAVTDFLLRHTRSAPGGGPRSGAGAPASAHPKNLILEEA